MHIEFHKNIYMEEKTYECSNTFIGLHSAGWCLYYGINVWRAKTDKKVKEDILNFAMLNDVSHLIVYPMKIDDNLKALFMDYIRETHVYFRFIKSILEQYNVTIEDSQIDPVC